MFAIHGVRQATGRAMHAVIQLVPWIKKSRQRTRKSFASLVMFMLLVSFVQLSYTHFHSRKASAVYIGLKDPVLPVSHNRKQIAEATVSVHQFLNKTRKLIWRRGLLSTADHRAHQRKQVLSLTTGQWLAYLLCMPIDLLHALCHQIMVLAVISCCVAPVAQLAWGLCPRLGITQLTNAPEQLVMSPLADAVCIHYVYHILVASQVCEYHYWLAALGLLRLDPVNNYPVFLVMAMAIMSDLAHQLPAKHPQQVISDHGVLVIRRQSWYRFYPSATLIAMLLVMGGVEINPGPFANIILIMMMMMALPTKRQRTEAQGAHFYPSYT